ncbi:hypothetical protein [Halomarina litorea]|uniref:hypothetical protein n=1 Tax=Halomarina litorea TaxID=2961595 RepID=UPI0020C290ED|nr:hypothetical protein [Halomarina sp. BCD28]
MRETESADRRLSRRAVLAGVAAASAGLGGCITVNPRVEADLSGSNVFTDVSVSEPWVNGLVEASVSLTRESTRQGAIRELVVTSQSGSGVWAGRVDPTQTTVSGVLFPQRGTATLAAADNNGKFVEAVTVRVSGTRVP